MKKPNNQKQLSNCCKAEIKTSCGDEGTYYWVCLACDKACDIYVPKQNMEWDKFDKKFPFKISLGIIGHSGMKRNIVSIKDIKMTKLKILSLLAKLTRKYHLRGTERFLRFIYPLKKRQQDNFQTMIKYDNLLININLSSFIEWEVFFKGYYEPDIIKCIKDTLKKDSIVFDVGANIGTHTLVMSDIVGEKGKVFAIEPHPQIFERLRENIKLNKLSNVISLQYALSDVRERSILYSFNKDIANHGISSLFNSNADAQEEIMVKVIKLDDIVASSNLSRLDFIKIDTEGSDYRILVGARESIVKFRPYILFEYVPGNSHDIVKEFFSELDYKLLCINANILACPN